MEMPSLKQLLTKSYRQFNHPGAGKAPLLIPAQQEFEKQLLLPFRLYDWPIAQISKQPSKSLPPSYSLGLTPRA